MLTRFHVVIILQYIKILNHCTSESYIMLHINYLFKKKSGTTRCHELLRNRGLCTGEEEYFQRSCEDPDAGVTSQNFDRPSPERSRGDGMQLGSTTLHLGCEGVETDAWELVPMQEDYGGYHKHITEGIELE